MLGLLWEQPTSKSWPAARKGVSVAADRVERTQRKETRGCVVVEEEGNCCDCFGG